MSKKVNVSYLLRVVMEQLQGPGVEMREMVHVVQQLLSPFVFVWRLAYDSRGQFFCALSWLYSKLFLTLMKCHDSLLLG